MDRIITVIGAGLAGAEAALTLSFLGERVMLYDCKPHLLSEAHKSSDFGELVCSNSLKSNLLDTASGLLKAELRLLGSRLIDIADSVAVQAGSALAVDRNLFSSLITKRLKEDKNITIVSKLVEDFDTELPTIIASGPLTLAPLANNIKNKLTLVPLANNIKNKLTPAESTPTNKEESFMYFYDAAAPIVMADSLDYDRCFYSSRYNKGTADYINCPMNKEEYLAFHSALVSAERAPLKQFEDVKVFEGCMPIELMAARGVDALRYAMLRPVGLNHPETGEKYYAVAQLRRENAQCDMFNLVGFQTNLTFSEQRKVFGMIPALANAEYARYGVMHRNSFINAPKILTRHFSVKAYKNVFVAGQLAGVEGYVESIASGLLAAYNIHLMLENKPMLDLPNDTMLGALARFIATPNESFQPMNANFGLLPPLEKTVRDKKLKKTLYSSRAIASLKNTLNIKTPD